MYERYLCDDNNGKMRQGDETETEEEVIYPKAETRPGRKVWG